MKISDHFDDKEFFSEATYKTLTEANRVPKWYISASLIYHLETIRIHFGKPLRITSGFRTVDENKLAGSTSPLSFHTLGKAVDFTVDGVEPKIVQEFIATKIKSGGLGRYKTFTHFDVRNDRNLVVWEG